MTLPAGTRLGAYEILASIGAGGMGEVYRAKDARLSREVAVKVLPAELALDAERLARFEQEARSASALNHPNIVTIYEVGAAEGVSYIAMELVDGKTLRELVAPGPLSPRRLLPIAGQVADGLAKAHESGIVHRDLKPENVMVNRDGFVKILDFGLAKLATPFSEGGSQLATLAGPGTRPGMVMGTVGYMSPEQASGEAVDFRSDQFSLGSILYEMATGKRAFQKKTAVETLSAIIREDPEPMAATSPQAPAPLRWIVERCLAKEPENRYAATRDLARDLKQTLDRLSETSMETPAVARPKKSRRLAWAAVLAALVILAAANLLRPRAVPPAGAPATLHRVTFGPGLEDEPSFSPDGKFMAYTTDERGSLDVQVLPLSGGEPIRIAATDADEAQPAWSPDGSRIAFVSAAGRGGRLSAALNVSSLELYLSSSHGDIYVAPALGGTAARLVEDGYYPSWSPDGKRIVFMSNREDRVNLWTVAADGGTPERLTRGDTIDYQPSWSPDGKWIAYGSGEPWRAQGGNFHLRVIPSGGGPSIPLAEDFGYVTKPAWGPDGAIVFSGEKSGILNIWRVTFRDGRRAAPLERVTLGQGQDTGSAVSRDGRALAFAAIRSEPNIWEVALDGGAPRQVTHGGSPDYPQVSPDGKTLLVESGQTGRLAVWSADLEGRYLARLSPPQDLSLSAHWSRDGKRIGYVREGKLYLQAVGSLSGFETGLPSGAFEWSPDGKRIAVGTPSGRSGEIRVYDEATRSVQPVTSLHEDSDYPTWSPDGSRIAFQLQRGNVREVWVVPSKGGEAKPLTKDLEDSHPVWSPTDPDAIVFLRDHKHIAVVSASTGQVRMLPFRPEGSYLFDYPSWSPDGKRIYVTVYRKAGDIYLLEGF